MASARTVEPAFDYYLVLDFEATCADGAKLKPQEIIEFPVVKLNARSLQVESEFHQYVGPTVHKQLTPFCTELTGITQDMVTGKPDLQTTLHAFDEWMKANGLLQPQVTFCFVTCGDWDLKTMLPGQCKHFNIQCPTYFDKWINIKKVYTSLTGFRATGMVGMLDGLKLKLLGRHHSGIDDARNITRILAELASRQPRIEATWTGKPKT